MVHIYHPTTCPMVARGARGRTGVTSGTRDARGDVTFPLTIDDGLDLEPPAVCAATVHVDVD